MMVAAEAAATESWTGVPATDGARRSSSVIIARVSSMSARVINSSNAIVARRRARRGWTARPRIRWAT
jgi:hypothetical protein